MVDEDGKEFADFGTEMVGADHTDPEWDGTCDILVDEDPNNYDCVLMYILQML